MRKKLVLLALLLTVGNSAMGQTAGVPAMGQTAGAPAMGQTPEPVTIPLDQIVNYRQHMRDIVEALGTYAKSRNRHFVLLARGGLHLFSKSRWESQLEDLHDPDGAGAYRRLPQGTLFRTYHRVLSGYVEDDRYCGPAAAREEARLKALAEAAEKAKAEERAKEEALARQKAKRVIRGQWTRVVVDPNPPPPAPPPPVNPLIAEMEQTRAKAAAEQAEADRTADRRLVESIKDLGLRALSIEHCSSADWVAKAMKQASLDRTLTFADIDPKGELDRIAKGRPWNENAANVDSLDEVKNMLVMVDSRHYARRDEWLMALAKSNHDLLIIDGFHKGSESLTKSEVYGLKFKRLGSRRLVFARLNLGEAQDYRYYWKREWMVGDPDWLDAPSPRDPAAMIVKYWSDDWKAIVGQYMAGLMDLGFDGIMLEGLDAYEHFEKRAPLE
ncbi:MAG: hypothetical protein HQL33_08615 [Alphaproteobacteria bacterium]|nr:hypothetical protein [Alphaproteobacteria bacterium]